MQSLFTKVICIHIHCILFRSLYSQRHLALITLYITLTARTTCTVLPDHLHFSFSLLFSLFLFLLSEMFRDNLESYLLLDLNYAHESETPINLRYQMHRHIRISGQPDLPMGIIHLDEHLSCPTHCLRLATVQFGRCHSRSTERPKTKTNIKTNATKHCRTLQQYKTFFYTE